MSCSNCFNGCTEIVSDQCVRYTGIDIPVLGIQNGDSLSYVEQALITFLTSTLDGSGIKPTISPTIICNLVQQYLPTCEDLTVTNVLTALIQAACNLQTQVSTNLTSINTINAQLLVLNGNYDVKCLPDTTPSITPSSGTHSVLQATIDSLCAFILNVETYYVLAADLDTLIQNYLNSITPSNQYNSRMIPYAIVPYFGNNGNFDNTGAGLSSAGFDKIFLCNGQNGTPDLRGRAIVGVINGMKGLGLSPVVDPVVNPTFNPNYSVGDTAGFNFITLTQGQMPSHTHGATATVTPNPHEHFMFNPSVLTTGAVPITSTSYPAFQLTGAGDFSYNIVGNATVPTLGKTSSTSLAVGVTNAPFGGGGAHDNKQPVFACYYIMYIP
jgi:microcystin-dependent protein